MAAEAPDLPCRREAGVGALPPGKPAPLDAGRHAGGALLSRL